MTRGEIYKAYLEWQKALVRYSEQELFDCVVGNQDVYEDKNILINYLYYQADEFHNGSIRCFYFVEANLFVKDSTDNLELTHSILLLPDQPTRSRRLRQ